MSLRFRTILGMVALPLLLPHFTCAAENWPQWRGPLGTGVAADGQYPVKFSSDDGVAWKVALPGRGSSTPAVWGEQIFVTCGIDGKDGLVCYGMDGRERWRQKLGDERESKHPVGSSSNPSPATDGQHVVVYFKSGTLACLDLAGEELWQVNLQDRYGKDTLWHDVGTSPVLAGDKVIVAVMQAGDSYLAAFSLADGSVAWKRPRIYDCAEESDQAYTTPQLVRLDGRDVIVSWGANHLTGHDAASGELLWERGGFNPEGQGYWRVIASATVHDGVAVVPFGRGEFLAAQKLEGASRLRKADPIWEKGGRGVGTDVPSPIIAAGRIYVLTDAGKIDCRDLKTGDELWSANLPRNRNKFYASPVLAGDKLYAAREDGTVFVGQFSDEGFELLSKNEMGEQVIATPIPIRGNVLLRGAEHLFCVGPGLASESQRGR